jgi:chromosome segregation ATPase
MLESALEKQEVEANEAIHQWENKASELEAELAHLEAVNSALESSSPAIIEQLQEELGVERGQHKEAREEIGSLSRELEDVRSESQGIIQQWSDRVDELLRRVANLECTLSQQESDANEAIATWERNNGELQSEVDRFEVELKGLTEKLAAAEAELAGLRSRHHDICQSEKDKDQKMDLIARELTEVSADRDRLKHEFASKSREKLEEERDRLTVVIAAMEEELKEANGLIQRYITNESSHRAAESAAHALRGEIETLKRQIQDFNSTADDERYRRELAEEEIERLRDDISALLSLNENEYTGEEVQQRTAKAVERLKTKERIEIDQLRQALYRSIEEVESARAAEKEVRDRLSKLRLQTTVGEQEIISAKSEIKFLAESLEELRMNEEEKRASLEYRIGSLEDENDMLRRYHSSELETVRNELAQVGMEKDRILHQLKESEKTNASLVLAASPKPSTDEDGAGDAESKESTIATEMAKLRIENAHLLTVAADDKARAERRLREVLAAHRATAEADTILEQELRLAAEATIQSLKAQLDEYRGSGAKRYRLDGISVRDDENQGKAEERVGMLAAELDALRQELQKVTKENAELRARMQQAARKAKDEIVALTEECRLAQAKATHIVREDRYDAAVQVEVARLRLSPGRAAAYRTFGILEEKEDDGAAAIRVEPKLVGAESYDLIHKHREDMEEERQLYREFLTEHDDLLALLAQNDLERDHLRKALATSAGSDVLAQVLAEVEALTLQEYGNIIKTVS